MTPRHLWSYTHNRGRRGRRPVLGPWQRLVVVKLYQEGMSLRGVQAWMEKEGVRVARNTILRIVDTLGLTRPEPMELYAKFLREQNGRDIV